jgi:hypothetical protein
MRRMDGIESAAKQSESQSVSRAAP